MIVIVPVMGGNFLSTQLPSIPHSKNKTYNTYLSTAVSADITL
jgi:hypothetical protein